MDNKIITRLLIATRKRNIILLIFVWCYVKGRHGLTLPFLSAFDLWTRGKEITNEAVKENAPSIIKMLSTRIATADIPTYTYGSPPRTTVLLIPQVYALPCRLTDAWVYSLHTGHRTIPSDEDMTKYPWTGISRVLDKTKSPKRNDVVTPTRPPSVYLWAPLQPEDEALFESIFTTKGLSYYPVVVTKVSRRLAAKKDAATTKPA